MSGTVRVVLGKYVRPDSMWEQVEFNTLKENPKVEKIISLDPLTKEERLIFSR